MYKTQKKHYIKGDNRAINFFKKTVQTNKRGFSLKEIYDKIIVHR